MTEHQVQIHPTAIVSPDTVFEGAAKVGPNCVIDGDVKVGEGVHLIANVFLHGPLRIGARSTVYPNACLGYPAQDLKFGPDDVTAGVTIGEDCVLREGVTIHASTNDHTPTTLGDRAFMMVDAHIGHDCTVGDDIIMVNGTALGGHVIVGNNVNIGGGAMVHQLREIGRLAFLAGGVIMSASVPPFCMATETHRITGLNTVGLRRAGISREEITKLREAYRVSLRAGLLPNDAVPIIREVGEGSPVCNELADWIERVGRQVAPDASARPPRAVLGWIRHTNKHGTDALDDGLPG